MFNLKNIGLGRHDRSDQNSRWESQMGFFTIPDLYGLTVLLLFSLLVAILFAGWTLHQHKQDSNVVNLSGNLSLLSQKLSNAAREVQLGNLDQIKALDEGQARFDKVLNGLINGNTELGLPPAETDNLRELLSQIKEKWAPFSIKLNHVKTAWPQVVKKLQEINVTDVSLFNDANTLVEDLSKIMDPETVSQAGRLRTITPRVTKAILQYTIFEKDESREECAKEIALGNKIISGLLNGNAELKIKRVDNPALREKIQRYGTEWKTFETTADGIFTLIPTIQSSLQHIRSQNADLLNIASATVEEAARHAEEEASLIIKIEVTILAVLFIVGLALCVWI